MDDAESARLWANAARAWEVAHKHGWKEPYRSRHTVAITAYEDAAKKVAEAARLASDAAKIADQ